jgi:hypothetical protein
LLTAADWSQFGYVTAAQPTINSDGPGSAYCVYAGTSGASGGLELDAFVAETDADAEETFNTIIGEGQPSDEVALPGADQAVIQAAPDGDYGAIVVRNGRLTFTISLPTSEETETQLTTLAAAVLSRSSAFQ